MAKKIFTDLKIRIIVGLILAAVLLVPIFLGGYWYLGLMVAIGLRIVQEWVRMTDPKGRVLAYAFPLSAMLISLGLAWQGRWKLAFIVALVGAFISAVERLRRRHEDGGVGWPFFGFFYLVIPCLAFIFVRGTEAGIHSDGLTKIAFCIAVVIFADIFAYIGGSIMKGPKIAPRLSPNKTWSGFTSGVVGGCIAGAVAAYIIGFSPFIGVVFSVPIIVFSVIGDFFESGVKRRWNVKDTGGVLPGHGGFLDRLDALMLAMTVFAIALILAPNLWPMS